MQAQLTEMTQDSLSAHHYVFEEIAAELFANECVVVYIVSAAVPFYAMVMEGMVMPLTDELGEKLANSGNWNYTKTLNDPVDPSMIIGDLYSFFDEKYWRVVKTVKTVSIASLIPDVPMVSAVRKKAWWKFWR